MEQKRNLPVRKPVTRVVLTVAIIAIGLSLAGCGRQMARIDENQLKLHTMVEANARQIADIAVRLEQNQQELHAVVKNVQNDVATVVAEMAVVADAQTTSRPSASTGGRPPSPPNRQSYTRRCRRTASN